MLLPMQDVRQTRETGCLLVLPYHHHIYIFRFNFSFFIFGFSVLFEDLTSRVGLLLVIRGSKPIDDLYYSHC